MSDRELRELERRWRESGSEDDRQRWLQARRRITGKPEVLLLTEDALGERGADWVRPRLPDALAAGESAGGDDPFERLLAEGFGPLPPSPTSHYRSGPTDPLEAAEERVAEQERYVRTLLELVKSWDRDPSGALASLAELIADLSSCDDAWYQDVAESAEEFFSLLGFEPVVQAVYDSRLEAVAEYAFTSWVLREGDARRFGNAGALAVAAERFAQHYRSGNVPNSLPSWRPIVPAGAAREALAPHLLATLDVDWQGSPTPEAAFRETGAVERYLERFDGPAHGDDPERARRLAEALASCRQLAESERTLTFEDLLDVQSQLLGQPAGVRTTPALAKGGSEAYASFDAFEALVRAKIDADLADDGPAVGQAARLYLDLIYFHPFEDGNARAALLALELVLRRARLPTPELSPLVRFPKPAGDATAYRAFVEALADGVARA